MLTAVLVLTAVAAHRWFGWDVAVVVSAGSLVLITTSLGLLGALVDMPLLSAGSRWIVGAVAVASSLLAARRSRNRLVADLPASPWVLLAAAPAGAALLAAFANAWSNVVAARWFAIIIDNSNHAGLIAEIRHSGRLDYATNSYPAGLHTLLATLANAAGSPTDLDHIIQGAAAVPWVFLAVFFTATLALSLRLSVLATLRGRALAYLATCLLLVASSGFIFQFVLYSASPSLLAAAVIVVPTVLAISLGTGHKVTLSSLPLVAALLANLWTVLVLVPVIVSLPCLVAVVRDSWGRPRLLWTTLTPPIVTSLLALPIALPVGLSLLSSGTGIAALTGSPEIPLPPVVHVTIIGLLWLLYFAYRREAGAILALSTSWALAVTAAYLLVATGDIQNLFQWYPVKAFWFAVSFTLPIGLAVSARVMQVAGAELRARAPRLERSLKTVLGAGVIMVAILSYGTSIWTMLLWPAITVPFAAARDTRITADQPKGLAPQSAGEASLRNVEIAREYATKFKPRLTVPISVGYDPVRDRRSSRFVSQIISLETGQPPTSGDFTDICSQISTATRGSNNAVVVTAAPDAVQALMRRGGCGFVPVQRIEWPINEVNLTAAVAVQSRKTATP